MVASTTGGYKVGQLQNYTPEQMNLFKQAFSLVDPGSFTSKLAGGDEQTFRQMEEPALRQFAGMQGRMASRFSGMGSGGARGSSGFQIEAGQQSSDFAQQLQAQRVSMQQQAIKDLMGMSTELMGQRPYENFLIQPEERTSGWQQFARGAMPLAGAAVGGMAGMAAGGAGGMAGAKFGASLGSAAAQAF